MEKNSLTQTVIFSTNSDATNVISGAMPENCNCGVRRFPIQSTKHTFKYFPVSFANSKERTYIAIIPDEFQNIRHKLNHFNLMLKGLCAQQNIEETEQLHNPADAFPFIKLSLKTKIAFPIKTTEGQKLSIPKDIKISLKNDSSNKRLTFPLIYPKGRSKFPLNESEDNLIKQPNIQAAYWLSNPYTSSPKPKLDIKQFSDIAESLVLVHFPVTKTTIKRQISREKCSDELVFPIKAEIFSNIHSTILKECYNNNADNYSSSSVMTPSQYLAHENMCGGILVDTNNKIKTNLESYEHEKLEQEQDQPTSTLPHNNNDDMLAMGESKNIFDSGQPKNCDELRHINEIQNSRSASETRYSHENMNDFQKQNQQQKIYETEPTTVTALAFNSMGNEMQRDHEMVFFAPSATRNNFSDKYLENQQEPWSTHLVYSEVRDPSSQEVLIVNGRVACDNSISRIKVAHPPSEKSSYVNESTLLTSLTPTPSTTVTTAEAPHVQNDCQCLVDRSFCSISNANDFGIYNISTEIDGKGGEKPTNSRHSEETNVFVKWVEDAMTLTKVVEVKKEDNISVSSSLFDDNLYPISDERSLSGMKIDMKSSKLTPDVTTRSVGSNTRVKSDQGQVMPGSGSSVLVAATDITKLANFGKTRRESSLLSQSRPTASADEKDSVLSPRRESSLLSPSRSTTSIDIKDSVLPPRRESSLLSQSRPTTSIDLKDSVLPPRRESSLLSQSRSITSIDEKDSVLPPRTLIRRQRRLQSQGSEDKQEDPIERLNRLRARISGALTEVKGVLKHYSVDEAAETDETPAQKNSVDIIDKVRATEETNTTAQSALKDDRPVNFRFVKKVRRRSVIPDDDDDYANKVTNEPTVENTGLTAKDDANKISTTTEKGAAEEGKVSSKDCSTNPSEIVHGTPEGHVTNNVEPKDHEVPQENVEADSRNMGTPAVPLGKENEGINSNDISLESRLEYSELEKTENVFKDEDKTQLERQIKKSKKSNRRASIALVEGSQIDPPVNALIPLKIKTQRRPSDSEALMKQKTKLAETDKHSSIKKVKTIVKVKRPSVKSNADVTTKNKKTSDTDINQSENNIKDAVSSALEVSNAITSVSAVTAKAAITATVPKTSETLSTQLAITTIAINDASSLSSAEKPTDESAEATQPLSIATNNSRSPTKLVDQNSAMVAPLVSPLRTGESSSHTIKSETQPLPLLVNNSNIDTSALKTPNDQHTNAEHLNVIAQTQINEGEDPAISKAQPTTQTDCADQQSLDLKPLVISNQTSQDTILPSVPDFKIIETAKSDPDISENQKGSNQEGDSQKLSSHTTEVCQSDDKMPEQQVAPTPVKPVQVFAENDSSKTNFSTKKTIIKRIVRKNSVDKAIEKKKANNNSQVTVAKTAEKHDTPISDSQPTNDAITEKSESTEAESTQCEDITTPDESSLEAPVESEKAKKSRKVKKKVIIKRQQRKLSLGENTFFKEVEQPEASSASTETLERAIAYVTDEEDEASEPDAEPIKPIKSCIKQREFQVGDWVMYGERYRKTQIRWRKGQITERITSISYKIDLGGTEVSAHISYIKKYTDRKVNFGGKEYLEIDYEQIAEEERKARTYSIWNMV